MTSTDNSTPIELTRNIHIIIDVLNDYISGSMASLHAKEAINKIIERINTHSNEEVLYICDAHPSNHCSFTEHGGPWPPHCIKLSFGQQIDLAFYTRVLHPSHRPRISDNIFEKGQSPHHEEYSGYHAISRTGKTLRSTLPPSSHITISGIPTEHCILETVKELIQAGHQITVLQDGLAYLSIESHRSSLSQMRELGARTL